MGKRVRRYVYDPYLELNRYGRDILTSPEYKRLLGFTQHKHSNTYYHSVNVALMALFYAKDNFIKVDVEALIKMCLLHDYFLYDWHIKPHPKKHATMHPVYAANNAIRDFGLEDKLIIDGIKSHMWPIAITRIPKSKEAWILTIADKKVSTNEVLRLKHHFQKRRLEEIRFARKVNELKGNKRLRRKLNNEA